MTNHRDMNFVGIGMSRVLLFSVLLYVSAAFVRAQPLVNHGDTWRYKKGTSAAQADWKTAADANLDGTWLSGPGGFGYGDPGIAGEATTLSDMQRVTGGQAGYLTIFTRRSFNVASAVDTNLHLQLTIDWDDGYVVYLDGSELNRAYVTVASPIYTTPATNTHEASCCDSPNPARVIDLGAVGDRLAVGTHIFAIHGLNQSSNSSDFHLIADLALFVPDLSAVSGPITANTTWYRTNSPIRVVGDVTVNSGVTLTIEPGVTVQLASGARLIVNGQLLAEGDATNRILFTHGTNATTWGAMTINGGAGSPETRITYADFDSYSTTAIHSTGGTLLLDHVNFNTTTQPYLSLDGSSFVVRDCVFPSSAPTARNENIHGTAGIKTGGRGIFVRNFFGVANSISSDYNDVLDFSGGNRPGPIVQFIDNVFIGSDDDLLDLDSTDAWVEGNIFLHTHRNGSPDSASAVSGGADNSDTSQITIIGNIIYDCDHAALAKQGNFYTLINNTIVRITRQGGVDGQSSVVLLADPGTVEGAGAYLEGNIIYDAEGLVGGQTSSIVTYTNNILFNVQGPAWTGPGGNNSNVDPLFTHVPQMIETSNFTTWASAQIFRQWFSLQSNSPAIGTGPNGRDKGGVIPLGASISGEPVGTTDQTNATLTVGFRRTGSGIPTAGWPNGSGYTHYKWRLDGGSWSAETPINTPIALTALADGQHQVDVTGKRDSGFYQDDPAFGIDALITSSHTWTVSTGLRITSAFVAPNSIMLEFMAQANTGYVIEHRESFSFGDWQTLVVVDPTGSDHLVQYTDTPGTSTHFYRVRRSP